MKNKLEKSKINIFPILLSLCLIGVVLSSCKKEYIDKYNIVPGDTIKVSGYKHIISFDIKENEDEKIAASITTENDIIVYWPIYKVMPEKISPEIILPVKTKISPASEESVDFKTGTKYKVTAEDGTEKTYTLKVIIQQAPFYFNQTRNSIRRGRTLNILGYGFYPNLSVTSVFLEKPDKTDPVPVTSINSISVSNIQVTIPANIEPGNYIIRIVNGLHSAYASNEDNRILAVTL